MLDKLSIEDHSVMYVASNGRLMFGSGSTDFSPTIAEALAGPAFAGVWTDLAPNQGGTIDVVSLGTGVRVVWNAVPYYGETATASFSVELCGACGAVRLDDLDSIQLNPITSGTPTSGDAMLFGISAGLIGGATDGGMTTFTPGGSGGPVTSTDMLYDFFDPTQNGAPGLPASLAPRTLRTLLLAPTGAAYTWSEI